MFKAMPRLDPQAPPLQRWWLGVLLYLGSGLIWIVVSDLLLLDTAAEPLWWSIAKGSAFVVVTAAVMAAVLWRVRRRLVAASEQLRQRESELTLLGANVADVVYRYELEPTPRFAFVSASAERLTGYSVDDFYDDPQLARRIVHPEDRDSIDDLSTMQSRPRLRWRHRSGRTMWFEQRNQVQLVDGRPVGLVGVAREVTREVLQGELRDALALFASQVLVEEADFDAELQVLCERLRSVFEASEIAVAIAPDDGLCPRHDVHVVGDRSAATTAPAELTDRSARTSVDVALPQHAPDPELTAELLPELTAGIESVHRGQVQDLELRRVRQALDATASAVMLTDESGHIQWVNKAFTAITGYAPEEAIGRTPRLLKGGERDAEFYAALWEQIGAGRSFSDQLRNRRKDGTFYTAAVTIDPVADRSGRIVGFIGVQRDVTEEEELRERVHRRELGALASQRDLEKDRTLLVQTISHELRTPLTVVLGVASTLQRPGLGVEAREQLLTALHGAGEQLLDRLDVLLAATDGVEGPPGSASGRTLVTSALARLAGRHDTDRVTITGDAPWWGYRTLAKALLRPLLDNALKYSPGSSPVQVAIDRETDGVRIVISDRGPGIDPGSLVRVEEPFRQVDGGRTREHGGFGLGLYAARRAAGRLDASMDISSGEQGTEVTLLLPDAAGGPGTPPSASDEVPASRAATGP